jgi:acyl-CoA thioesterase FadM
LKPVPLETPLTVNAGEKQVVGREHTNFAEIVDGQGKVLARSTGVFVVVDLRKKFAQQLGISD